MQRLQRHNFQWEDEPFEVLYAKYPKCQSALQWWCNTKLYGNCFDESDKYDNYRPLFWYKDSDKEDYERAYWIIHSKCYTEYGLKRTGCCGCPYGRDFEYELDVIEKYEHKLYKAVTNIFKDSYEYTRKYVEFRKMMDEKERIK